VLRLMRVWTTDRPHGTELADVSVGGDMLSATGVAIGTDPVPYRLDYQLTTVDRYVTARLIVSAQGQGWRRILELERAASGAWSCRTDAEGTTSLPLPGGDPAALAGALDCDLARSPLTNSMPVLRHGLHEGGGPVDFLMSWVSVPDLAVRASRQRYTFVRQDPGVRIVRYESLGGTFAADISFDHHGVVLDYPGIARHVS
jgi:uncharacterized protein